MAVSVFSLWLPVLLSGIALFFASFLSWMVFQLHKADWKKAPSEDGILDAIRQANLAEGSYMLPGNNHPSEMKSPEFQKKYEAGPRGILTVMPKTNMGANLGITFVYFLVSSFFLAYLATIAFKSGESFLNVFRFIFTAGLLGFLGAMIPQSVWFKNRIVGHAIEAVAYSAIAGAIFAAMWPK